MAFELGCSTDDKWLFDNFGSLDRINNDRQRCAKCQGRESCEIDGYFTSPEIMPYGLSTRLQQCDKDYQFNKQKRINELLKSSRLPDLFRKKTFENFVVSPGTNDAFLKAQTVAAEGEKGIVLAGPPGVGKSHLAAAVMNARIEQTDEAIFCTVPELLADIRRAMNSQQETTELIELVKESKLLILDDLGAERVTEWVAEQLFVIINARVMREKLTVITTNYQKPSDLIEKLGGDIQGKRIVSRIFELCQWVNMNGEDYRLKGSI